MPYGQDGQYPNDGSYPADGSYSAGDAYQSYPPTGQCPAPDGSAYPTTDAYQYPTAQYPVTQQYPDPAQQYSATQYPTQGYAPQMPQATGYGQSMAGGYPAKNGVATCALALGIASQVLFFCAMAAAFADATDILVGTLALSVLALGIASLIFGIIGMSKAKQLMGMGRGKAITGMVLGALASVALIGIIVLGMSASPDDLDTESDRVMQTDGNEDATTQRNAYGEDSDDGTPSNGDSTSGSTSGYTPSDNLTEEQLDAMLAGGVIWEGHVDNGTIGSKFTFDNASHTYSYWRGDADPATNTGDRISGTYEVYFDEAAYKYVNDLAGTGDKAKEQIAKQSETRGEPVHYMILVTTPQTQNIGGVETASDDKRPFAWEGTWMTQSKHIGLVNTNSGNSYDMYDSTVPADQRETAATRLHDMVMGDIEEQDSASGQDGSEG